MTTVQHFFCVISTSPFIVQDRNQDVFAAFDESASSLLEVLLSSQSILSSLLADVYNKHDDVARMVILKYVYHSTMYIEICQVHYYVRDFQVQRRTGSLSNHPDTEASANYMRSVTLAKTCLDKLRLLENSQY